MALRPKGSGAFIIRYPVANLLRRTRSFTPTEVQNLTSTPIEVVPAPGAGKLIVPFAAGWRLKSTGHTPYANGNAINFGWDTDPFYIATPASFFRHPSDWWYQLGRVTADQVPSANYTDHPLVVSVDTTPFTGGTGCELKGYFYYLLLD